MWNDLTLVVNAFFDYANRIWAMYVGVELLQAVLAIWVVRKVLKAFNLL